MKLFHAMLAIITCISIPAQAARLQLWSSPEVTDITKTISIGSDKVLHLRNDNGSVRVTSGDTRNPRIHAYIYGPEGYTQYVELTQQPEGQQHTVTAQLGEIPEDEEETTTSESKRKSRRKPKKKRPYDISDFYIDYYVTLPSQAGIAISSNGRAYIEATDVHGYIGIEGAYATIFVSNAGSSVSAHSARGDITCNTVRGYVDAKSDAGNLTLEHIQGDVNAVAHGSIMARDLAANASVRSQRGSLSIENVSGVLNAYARDNIEITQRTLSDKTSIFAHSRHSVQLYVPRNINAHLHAKTTKSIVTSDIPITLEPITTTLSRDIWRQMRRHVEGSIGQGGAHITVDATSHIHLYEVTT